MKNTRTTFAALLLSLGLSACGGSGSKDSKKGKDNNSDKVSESDVDSYNYDFSMMSEMDTQYATDLNSDVLWNVRVAVNGKEKSNLENAVLADVKNNLSTIDLKHYDQVRTEITVMSQDRILATNLKEVVADNPSLLKIWDNECAFIDEPEQEVSEADFEFIEGQNRLMLKVEICDFAGFALKPAMQIKPQPKNLPKKLVVYRCKFSPDSVSTSETSPYIEKYTGDTPCGYGYETLPGEEAPKIEILKQYAPGTSLYNSKLLRFDDVKLGLGNAGQFLLSTDFYNPPFGSLTACHTIKLDVKYAGESGVQTKRLVFKRSNQQGGVTWMPQNAENWPSMRTIAKYYKQASAESVHLYRFCEWLPEAQDLNAGQVISITPN